VLLETGEGQRRREPPPLNAQLQVTDPAIRWDSGQVHSDLSALQSDGTVKAYTGTYTVSNGVIVGADIVQAS
jgi:hypothetical protein